MTLAKLTLWKKTAKMSFLTLNQKINLMLIRLLIIKPLEVRWKMMWLRMTSPQKANQILRM